MTTDNLHLVVLAVPAVQLGHFKWSGGELGGKTGARLAGVDADNKTKLFNHWRASLSPPASPEDDEVREISGLPLVCWNNCCHSVRPRVI